MIIYATRSICVHVLKTGRVVARLGEAVAGSRELLNIILGIPVEYVPVIWGIHFPIH